MIEFLQKFILGSLLLYSVYYLFLRNEKTLRFNRFYLLFIVPLSLIIPLITVHTSYVEIPVSINPAADYQPAQEVFYIPDEPTTQTEEAAPFNWYSFLNYGYLTICAVLLFRFAFNLFRLNSFRKKGELLSADGCKLCLRDDLKTSFTFLNTIFTNKSKYMAGLLPESILKHEMAHINQKHSYDIILMELLSIAVWFNPVIYLIKQSIKLNHEYLADEAVCKSTYSPHDYQKTLINYSKINSNNEPLLTSRLTFGETKKRLKMMVKTTHRTTQWIKQSVGLIAVAAAVMILGDQRVVAQEPSAGTDISQAEVHEDSTLLGKKVVPLVQLSPDTKIRYLDATGTRVEREFGNLSREQKSQFASQQAEGEVWTASFMDAALKWRRYGEMLEWAKGLKQKKVPNFFNGGEESKAELKLEYNDTIPFMGILSKNPLVRFKDNEGNWVEKKYNLLTPSELEKFRQNGASPAYYVPRAKKMDIPENFAKVFEDEKEYGVWLDGKRIQNSELKNYSASEIHHYYKSVLLKNAKNYGVHTFQLNIYTDQYMEGKPEGTWINLLTIPDGGVDSMKRSKTNNEPTRDKRNDLAFKGFDTTKVEYFRVPTPGTHVRFIGQKKNLVVNEWKNLSTSQKRQWYTNGNNGMIFNPPETNDKITYDFLQSIINETNAEVWLDDKKVDRNSLNSIYPHELYDFTRTETTNGRAIYTFITKNTFLVEKWSDKYWISNVLYKKSDSDQ